MKPVARDLLQQVARGIGRFLAVSTRTLNELPRSYKENSIRYQVEHPANGALSRYQKRNGAKWHDEASDARQIRIEKRLEALMASILGIEERINQLTVGNSIPAAAISEIAELEEQVGEADEETALLENIFKDNLTLQSNGRPKAKSSSRRH